ncbi:MAG: hypothetical protein A3I44_04490 [Candidatus Sungbacteria bacterium RIFCSPLOWO2_02_FULL_51_17]|uniref:Uncharacterized protein n=1 Tax=Candidatus Sungbacteria bacterium RIFCSPHIGHO2_02_FULL_51_29 TaxID=1802273 RepID=A0A1G2KT04_9BACT|nr:MAG: hypothetical protein A2676_02980 [Candidatus Sungbacteria bacterium RIFCSPHIGHO2_01_FULL_51_22]OHA01581.1 MAG: hypothetical protein A3C16_00385 [Candidatus Sungbacteria bacterium RIFCSPHIGHO2_02_FULL_51_29]OHA04679.1 MAG: hypothetical protein A3B29_01960 [Candidatus Sungbacteria bacterium RIFCSPLOWO2_01_FULL_51_34]OHA12151.1 MAG: hypothetical protein A3I44_04490 [Candidatus Sungbacteria bacterium RIFCSPLOWO2_02_FULL_51_17]
MTGVGCGCGLLSGKRHAFVFSHVERYNTGMRTSCVAIICFVFVVFSMFGVFTMVHMDGMSHDGCLIPAVGGVCPLGRGALFSLASLVSHLDVFTSFSLTIFVEFSSDILIMMLLAMVSVPAQRAIVVSFDRTRISPLVTQVVSESFFVHTRRRVRWLALHELSPSCV